MKIVMNVPMTPQKSLPKRSNCHFSQANRWNLQRPTMPQVSMLWGDRWKILEKSVLGSHFFDDFGRMFHEYIM
jgi:hypothetical protein